MKEEGSVKINMIEYAILKGLRKIDSEITVSLEEESDGNYRLKVLKDGKLYNNSEITKKLIDIVPELKRKFVMGVFVLVL